MTLKNEKEGSKNRKITENPRSSPMCRYTKGDGRTLKLSPEGSMILVSQAPGQAIGTCPGAHVRLAYCRSAPGQALALTGERSHFLEKILKV